MTSDNQLFNHSMVKCKSVLDAISIGIILYDSNGILLNMNEEASKIFGIQKQSEIQNQYLFLDYFKKYAQKLKLSLLDESDIYEIDLSKIMEENTIISTIKHKLTISIHRKEIFDSENKFAGTIITVKDLTTAQKMNDDMQLLYEQTANLAQSIPIGIQIYDKDGLLTFSNDAAADIFGFIDKNEYLKHKRNIFDNPAIPKDTIDFFRKGNDSDYSFEYDFSAVSKKHYFNTYKKGKIYLNTRGRVYRDKYGNISSYIVIIMDITSYIEMIKALKKAKDKAIEAEKMKSSFLANVSHEIRTPINSIVGFANLLKTAESDEERIEFEKIITSNSEILINLINDILDLSKMEAGFTEFNNEPFDISELFNSLYLTILTKKREDVYLEVNIPKDISIINSDRQKIMQITLNFLTNASKFTSSGHIKFGYEPFKNGIRLWVEDTGMGIAKENMDNLFVRFKKFNKDIQGTGLGLSICKSFVEMIDGDIGVESELGKGSTFWAYIPCKILPANAL